MGEVRGEENHAGKEHKALSRQCPRTLTSHLGHVPLPSYQLPVGHRESQEH